MNYGMQLAASSALTGLYRMDVLSNNLANVETKAFKPDLPTLLQRPAERVEKGDWSLPSSAMLERLGGGVTSGPNWTKFEQGSLTPTGNSFDLAIQGPGFFVVRDESDFATGDRLRLTRDGRFLRDSQGRLASAISGMPVMDSSNRPIFISDGAPVSVERNGAVVQRGSVVGQIQLTDVRDTSRLKRLGQNLFQPPADVSANRHAAAGEVRQGELEESAVDPIATLMSITEASRAVETATLLMQGHDRVAERAINGLGRVA